MTDLHERVAQEIYQCTGPEHDAAYEDYINAIAEILRREYEKSNRVTHGKYEGTTADHAAEIAEGHAVTIKEMVQEQNDLKAKLAEAVTGVERLDWMIATNCFVVRSRSVISPEQYIVVQGLDRDNILGSGETARAAIDNAMAPTDD